MASALRQYKGEDLEYIYNDFKPIQKVLFHKNIELLLITLTYGQKYVFSQKHNLFVLLEGKVSLQPNYNTTIEIPYEIYYIEKDNKEKIILSEDHSVILNLSYTKLLD
jgi:hypothetical protein